MFHITNSAYMPHASFYSNACTVLLAYSSRLFLLLLLFYFIAFGPIFRFVYFLVRYMRFNYGGD
jgi:hypothetical protein